MSDEAQDATWWRNEARRLYADVAQARRERDEARAEVERLRASHRATQARDFHSGECSASLLRWLESGAGEEWACSCGLDSTIATLKAEVERLRRQLRTDATRKAPVSWVAP